MPAINTYTTVERVRKYMTLASANVGDDEDIDQMLFRASRAIDRYTRRHFYPRLQTRFYDFKNTYQVRLDDDLASLSLLRTQNGACPVASGVMYLATGEEWNRPPYDKIVLRSDSGSVLNFSGRMQRANEVTAWWCYHEDPDNMWIDTGTSLAANYTASAGSMSLGGAGSVGTGASDAYGEAPRISIGDILKIGDQVFNVIGTGGAPSILSVRPYANGTTAVSHGSTASIAKFAPEPDIEWATRRLVTWMYGQTMVPYQARTAFTPTGSIEFEDTWPRDVIRRLERLKKRSYSVYPM